MAKKSERTADLADRLNDVKPSGIREIFDLASELDDPVNLSIGQPSFDVPETVKQEATKAIEEGKNKYTGTRGDPELREQIANRVKKNTRITPPDVLVTAGVSGGLVLSLLSLCNPGDQVLVPDPYFVSYKYLSNLLEADPEFIDTYPDFKIDPHQLQNQISENSRILLFNNPVNPTGVSYSQKEIQTIARICDENQIWVLSDEIYSSYTYDREHASMYSEYPERTILLNGFSKTYGMPGWRMGWAAGPEDILDAMAMIQQYSFVCAHTPSQHACKKALEIDMSEDIMAYRDKRDRLYDGLDPAYDVQKPEGAFYMFPRVPNGSGTSFARKALDRELMIVPGSAFSQKDTHFRISYAVSDEELENGIRILNELVS